MGDGAVTFTDEDITAAVEAYRKEVDNIDYSTQENCPFHHLIRVAVEAAVEARQKRLGGSYVIKGYRLSVTKKVRES